MANENLSHLKSIADSSHIAEKNEMELLPFGHSDKLSCPWPQKRDAKRSYLEFGLSTLSSLESGGKKRSRKDYKRISVDKLEGFTFISAYTLNDFVDYDKSRASCPSRCNKQKSNTTIKSKSSKKVTSLFIKKDIQKPLVDVNKSSDNPSKLESQVDESVVIKDSSPLTKSALCRLKNINIRGLRNINELNKESSTRSCVSNASLESETHNLEKSSTSFKKMNLQKEAIDVLSFDDEDDDIDLDVCSVDIETSSKFIHENKSTHDYKCVISVDENIKKVKKPCSTCFSYPCKIVGAKRVKNHQEKFPCFNVSYSLKCQIHTPGVIKVDESKLSNKMNVSIQTTSTDIQIHQEFAKRFPYRIISVLSCEPNLCNDDLKLTDAVVKEEISRCSETHRVLEQKRRDELQGLYCNLAETLLLSKTRASKIWILQSALKQINQLESDSSALLEKLILLKSENQIKRKRWEELAGQQFVAPEKILSKQESLSKLLQTSKTYQHEMSRPTITNEVNAALCVKTSEKLLLPKNIFEINAQEEMRTSQSLPNSVVDKNAAKSSLIDSRSPSNAINYGNVTAHNFSDIESLQNPVITSNEELSLSAVSHNASNCNADVKKEYINITLLVDSKATTFKVPKSNEGFSFLNKLSLAKKMSTNSRLKIAKYFPSTQTFTFNQMSNVNITSSNNTSVPSQASNCSVKDTVNSVMCVTNHKKSEAIVESSIHGGKKCEALLKNEDKKCVPEHTKFILHDSKKNDVFPITNNSSNKTKKNFTSSTRNRVFRQVSVSRQNHNRGFCCIKILLSSI